MTTVLVGLNLMCCFCETETVCVSKYDLINTDLVSHDHIKYEPIYDLPSLPTSIFLPESSRLQTNNPGSAEN